MKRNCELRTAALAALFLAGLCVPGHSAPTPEQRAERTNLLIQAIDNNNVEQAKACIKLGADVNATVTDKYGDTRPILIHAICKENKEIAEQLIKAGTNVNAKTDDGGTAIMSAASFGLKDIAEQLIKAGANVNAKADGGWTALMYAAGNNEAKDIVELLIKSGADINAKNEHDSTALIYAARNGNIKATELLIKAGADVNAMENTEVAGQNALMYAASNGHKEITELLIKAGADVNAISCYTGESALLDAIYEHIHSLHTVSSWMTEAEVAKQKTATRLIAKLLVKAGADIDTLFIDIIKYNSDSSILRNNVSEPYLNEAMVKLFIDLGADVNATDSEGISVLTYAALYGRNDIVELLKAAGARE